tara:strand:+ start:1640 stop:2551 length:912 start_codon:yes stop_codon:yes gene_type:complete
MKNILVTGATGFIGRHCLPMLIDKGYDVHAISSNPVFNPDGLNIKWHQCDLLNINETSHLLNTIAPSKLLHFAWYAKPDKYWDSLNNFDWIQASLHLIKEFHAVGGKRVVVAGTCAEYDWDYGYCSEYLTPLFPDSTYGKCKHALQMLLESFSNQSGLSSAWGRIFYLYGPYENEKRLVSSVITSLKNKQFAKCSQGLIYRDFLHVKDVANAFIALLESNVSGPVNIGSGSPVMIKDLILMIANKFERLDLIELGALKSQPDEARLLVANTSKLNNEIKWTPDYTLDSGLDQTISWWKSQPGM